MKTIALYARVSSEQQAQQATIGSQIDALRERAIADGQHVLPGDLYEDDGFSGATLIRPALERLRDRIAEGAIDIVYMHNPDRLARRYAYQVLLLEEFAAHGTSVVFLQGPSTNTAEDALLVQVQGMIAEYERAKITERCRRGKLHRARQGTVNPMSGAPYGYLYVRKSETEPARYDVLLPEAKVVRRIFDELVHEQKSIGEIMRTLYADGIPTRRGAPRWDRATVWGILRNPAYMGQAAYGKTEATERGRLLRPIRGGLGPRTGARVPTATSRRSSGSTFACPPSCRPRSSTLHTINWHETGGSRSETRGGNATCCKVSSSAPAAGTRTTARPCRNRRRRAGAGTPTTAASAPTPSASPAVASAPTGRCARTSSTTTYGSRCGTFWRIPTASSRSGHAGRLPIGDKTSGEHNATKPPTCWRATSAATNACSMPTKRGRWT